MKTLYFDGFDELRMSDMALDDNGRIVPRDDYETHQEILEAIRDEQHRRRVVPTMMVAAAWGMLLALLVLWAGGRIPV